MSGLPKALHTVRILVAVAEYSFAEQDPIDAVIAAAQVLGYPDAGPNDPLIDKAAVQLGEKARIAYDLAPAPKSAGVQS